MEENINPENQEKIEEQPVASEPAPAEEAVVQPPVEEEKAEVKEEKAEAERRWYVIQTFTGQEDKAKQALEFTVESEGLKDRVFQVLVPLEETVEIKGGKRLEKVRKMFPGYVFLDMVLDEETWYLIRQTPGVARFIGTKVKPTPVSDKEMQRVLKQLGKEERFEVTFEKGEGIRVISGPFRGYTGTVDDVNAEKGKLKVLINIFGRDTPVEVNFEHAQKIV
jgi:transcriptional antiterminator NusG